MITQHEWNAALQSDRVRTTARSALALLKKQELQETQSAAEIDWALHEVLEGEHLPPAEYYATFVHVLNPWMLEIPTKAEQERDYRLDLMRAWERRWEGYLIVLLRRCGGKVHFSFEDLASLDGVRLSLRTRLDGTQADVWIDPAPLGE